MLFLTRCGACAPPGSRHGADDEIGVGDLGLDGRLGAEDGLDAAVEDVVEVGEALGALVDDDRARADADGHLRRVGAHGAAADDDDLGLRHAGDAAEEHAAAAVVLLQVSSAGLDGQLAGDLAHREEQRMGAGRGLDGLEGDGTDASGDHGVGELARIGGGHVEVREEDLPRPELVVLDRDGLLDLVDHVGAREHVVDGRRARRPRPCTLHR